MKQYPAKIFSYKKVRLFFALTLFAVIGLHTIHFDHDHQKEIFGDSAQAIMHGSDKKHFFVLDTPNFAGSNAFSPVEFFIPYYFVLFNFLFGRVFDSFREALRRGIINSKVYAWVFFVLNY